MTREMLRKFKTTRQLVKKYNLDLTGLNVFTEAATGNYFFTAIAAALAGAKNVFAYNSEAINIMAKFCGFFKMFQYDFPELNSIEFVTDKNKIAEADIITNSGYVRPITSKDVDSMKKTAVIALMMQIDQVRNSDINLVECFLNGIKCVPVDEYEIGIAHSMNFKLMKVLFVAGLSVWGDKYLFCGGGDLTYNVLDFFNKNGIHADKISSGSWLGDTNKLCYDAIVIHDYYTNTLWVGKEKDHPVISIERILAQNPLLKIINISGNADIISLVCADIDVFPLQEPIYGKTTISGDYLSHKVTIELNVAALKAAEKESRRRLNNDGIAS